MQTPPDRLPPTLPLVVHVGFAGSRMLYASTRLPAARAETFDAALLPVLVDRLRELPQQLGLGPHHLLCGVSQLAAGADTLFARALEALALPLRVRLPQAASEFLAAGGSEEPDFTPAERDSVRALLDSPHVIEVRVASKAEDRVERFEDTNLAILRDSDAIVCLLRASAGARAGGTRDLMRRAARAGKTVLLLEVSMVDDQPVLSDWRLPEPGGAPAAPPAMPAELKGLELPAPTAAAWPDVGGYIDAVRQFASAQTRRHSGGFRRAALTIIVLHIVATVLAAVAGGAQAAWWVGALLALELVLLGTGLLTHHALHHSLRVRVWAVTRLLVETLRSMKSVCATGAHLDYPLALGLPAAFSPLLRTVAALHVREQRHRPAADWSAQRAAYLALRLTGAQGQLRYFSDAAHAAARRFRWANGGFWLFSATAIAATGAKLAAVAGVLPAALAAPAASWGGLLAITLPVAAVGFLSWAAASDLHGRATTYAEMQAFLVRQAERLQAADSAREFARLVHETELGILSENLGWFSRQMFRGVA
jgi:hypothetical protein